MVPEASLEQTESGLVPNGEGWYVLNAKESRWLDHPAFGWGTTFEGEPGFKQIGINISVLNPGQPLCLYHREGDQEDFLVLFGEAVLLVEGEERPLKAWDFFHSPSGTDHVIVGAGHGQSAILAVGGRGPDDELFYPASELAARYGASAEKDTPDPKEAYAPFGRSETVPYRGQLDGAS